MKVFKLGIIGTNGIPARYGGFETLAENLVLNLSNKYKINVYCSNIYERKERDYKYINTNLIYIPLKANGIQSVVYDIISYLHAAFTVDVILYFGPTSSGFFVSLLNLFFRKKIIVNHGGLNEWEREKYSLIEKKWAKINHKYAAKLSTINISDNPYLKQSLTDNFKSDSVVIEYGGNHVNDCKTNNINASKYSFINDKFLLCVARAQIDNNLHLLIESFKSSNTQIPLVIISNWTVSQYGETLYRLNNRDIDNLILLPAIYDTDVLNYIRRKCLAYIHSHSFCGTAPSLVEAMCMQLPIISYDVPTNRYTTDNNAIYFKGLDELNYIVQNLSSFNLDLIGKKMLKIATSKYQWSLIAEKYKNLIEL